MRLVKQYLMAGASCPDRPVADGLRLGGGE